MYSPDIPASSSLGYISDFISTALMGEKGAIPLGGSKKVSHGWKIHPVQPEIYQWGDQSPWITIVDYCFAATVMATVWVECGSREIICRSASIWRAMLPSSPVKIIGVK